MSSSHLFFGLSNGLCDIGFHLYTFFLPLWENFSVLHPVFEISEAVTCSLRVKGVLHAPVRANIKLIGQSSLPVILNITINFEDKTNRQPVSIWLSCVRLFTSLK